MDHVVGAGQRGDRDAGRMPRPATLSAAPGGDRVRHGGEAEAGHVELHGRVARVRAPRAGPSRHRCQGMSWRRCRASSHAPVTSASRTGLPVCDRLRDGHHRPHRGDAVRDVGAVHRRAIRGSLGKALELAAVEMAVGAQHATRGRASASRKMSTSLRLVVPGVDRSSRRRCRSRRRSGSPRASPCAPRPSGRGGRARRRRSPRRRTSNRRRIARDSRASTATMSPPKIARRVDEMAAMRQHVVAAQVGLGIAGGLLRAGAGDDQRLHGIGHRVAMGAVAVPGLEREQFAHLVVDEGLGRLRARIEALHVADLQHLAATLRPSAAAPRLPRPSRRPASRTAHACRPPAPAVDGRHMEGVRGRDDDRVELGIGQHRVVVGDRSLSARRWPPCAAADRRPRRRWRRGRRCAPWCSFRNARPGRSGRSPARRCEAALASLFGKPLS